MNQIIAVNYRSTLMSPGVVLAIGILAVTTQAQVSGSSLGVQIYSDGSAYAVQHMPVSPNATLVVQLLTPVLSEVVATDQGGAPLEFQLSGSSITIYTLGASAVTLSYDSLNLTSKEGTVWTVRFTTTYETTLTLPKLSTLTYISGSPDSMTVTDGYPVAVLSPGKWVVSYGAAIGQTGTTTGSTSTGGNSPGFGVPLWAWGIASVAAALVAGGFLFAIKRRAGLGAAGAQLRPDDVQVLNFISERGGKVQESEIRTKFILPKTSAWRQIKRLERLGYVKVTRIGSQNQVELVKKSATEA